MQFVAKTFFNQDGKPYEFSTTGDAAVSARWIVLPCWRVPSTSTVWGQVREWHSIEPRVTLSQ